MKFGIGIRKKMSGAGLYVTLFQAVTLGPLLYFLVASGYMTLFTANNPLTWLCDFGLAALPRWETLLASFVYRRTASEVAAHFVLLGFALVLGFAGGRFFNAKHDTARTARIVFAALIAADLVLRVLPFHFNIAFGWPAAIFGFVFRAGCLALLLLDLRADNKARAETAETV